MNARPFFLSIIFATLCVSAIGQTTIPTGCPAPTILNNTLRDIGSRSWSEISKADIQSLWPAEMGALDCNDKMCQTLQQEGKVVNGECECCELFNFDTDNADERVSRKEHLYSVVIYYSTSDRRKTVEAAKSFARAFGAEESETSTIGRKSLQHLYWNVAHGQTKEVTLMDVHMTHRGEVWRVYIHFSRHAA